MFDRNTKNLWILLTKELKNSEFLETKVNVKLIDFAKSCGTESTTFAVKAEAQRCINLLDSFSLCADIRGTKLRFALSQRSSKVTESDISFRFNEDYALSLKQLIEE